MAKGYKLLKNYLKDKKKRYKKAASKILEKFECKRCGECCRYLVYLTKNEAKRISKFTKLPIKDFAIAEEPYLFMYPCPFYSNERKICSIHPVRPISCKLFPFHREENVLLEVDYCPLSREICTYINSRIDILEELSVKYINIELEKSVWNTLKRLEGLENPNVDEMFEKGEMGGILSFLRDLYDLVRYSVEFDKISAINKAASSVETKFGKKRFKRPCKNFKFPVEFLEAVAEMIDTDK